MKTSKPTYSTKFIMTLAEKAIKENIPLSIIREKWFSNNYKAYILFYNLYNTLYQFKYNQHAKIAILNNIRSLDKINNDLKKIYENELRILDELTAQLNKERYEEMKAAGIKKLDRNGNRVDITEKQSGFYIRLDGSITDELLDSEESKKRLILREKIIKEWMKISCRQKVINTLVDKLMNEFQKKLAEIDNYLAITLLNIL